MAGNKKARTFREKEWKTLLTAAGSALKARDAQRGLSAHADKTTTYIDMDVLKRVHSQIQAGQLSSTKFQRYLNDAAKQDEFYALVVRERFSQEQWAALLQDAKSTLQHGDAIVTKQRNMSLVTKIDMQILQRAYEQTRQVGSQSKKEHMSYEQFLSRVQDTTQADVMNEFRASIAMAQFSKEEWASLLKTAQAKFSNINLVELQAVHNQLRHKTKSNMEQVGCTMSYDQFVDYVRTTLSHETIAEALKINSHLLNSSPKISTAPVGDAPDNAPTTPISHTPPVEPSPNNPFVKHGVDPYILEKEHKKKPALQKAREYITGTGHKGEQRRKFPGPNLFAALQAKKTSSSESLHESSGDSPNAPDKGSAIVNYSTMTTGEYLNPIGHHISHTKNKHHIALAYIAFSTIALNGIVFELIRNAADKHSTFKHGFMTNKFATPVMFVAASLMFVAIFIATVLRNKHQDLQEGYGPSKKTLREKIVVASICAVAGIGLGIAIEIIRIGAQHSDAHSLLLSQHFLQDGFKSALTVLAGLLIGGLAAAFVLARAEKEVTQHKRCAATDAALSAGSISVTSPIAMCINVIKEKCAAHSGNPTTKVTHTNTGKHPSSPLNPSQNKAPAQQ